MAGETPRSSQAQGKVLLCVALWCAVSALFCHHFICRAVVVTGTSMLPTIKDGDIFIVETMTPHLRQYERAEIVILNDGKEGYAIKRIIGLPGEKVQIRNGSVLINGQPLRENYLGARSKTPGPGRTVFLGANEYFVLGDNRWDSYDSRRYGAIGHNAILASVSRNALAIK